MRNLLGNAWKYTAQRSEGQIHVYADHVAGEYCFCVEDNGAGFNMEHAEKLFLPFQRLHRQDEFQGLGIGLATVQRIIHRHGGKVTGTGIAGQGARFCFSLPLPDDTVTNLPALKRKE
jgi:signal transduction histidine kinase